MTQIKKSQLQQPLPVTFLPPKKQQQVVNQSLLDAQIASPKSRQQKNASQPVKFTPNNTHLEVQNLIGTYRNKTPIDSLANRGSHPPPPNSDTLRQVHPKGQIKSRLAIPPKQLLPPENSIKSISFYKSESDGDGGGLTIDYSGQAAGRKQQQSMRVAGQTVFSKRGNSVNYTLQSARDDKNSEHRNEQKRYENIVSKSRAQRHRASLRGPAGAESSSEKGGMMRHVSPPPPHVALKQSLKQSAFGKTQQQQQQNLM